MFGEYSLYAQRKVVALVCDDQLHVKIVPASGALAELCDKDSPDPGAKPHYVVEEAQLSALPDWPPFSKLPTRSRPPAAPEEGKDEG